MAATLTPPSGGPAIRSLHIIGSRQMGGAERFFQRLVAALDAAGHPTAAVCRSSSPLARDTAPAGGAFQVPMRSGWDLYSVWRIRRLLQGLHPQIVQTYMGRASRLTRVPAGAPCAHVARLGGYYRIDGYFRHAHAWVGNTRGLCDYLVRSGLPAARVHLIGNFVAPAGPPADASRCDLRAAWGMPADALVVFALGRLIAKKGFADLLAAFARLPAAVHGRPVWLLIAGAGPLEQRLAEMGAQLGIAPRLRWAGWQPEPGRCFAGADLFVCPSTEEPLGNVILEAWAHRLPVVSTRTAGAEELIAEGRNGLLVPCGDPEAMAQRLGALLADDAARDALADEGARTVRRCHSLERVTSAYLDLYRSLLPR
jgi:glycosyltransferase involved in cell wall biosynthesis